MKVELWLIGKTAFPYLEEGMAVYEKRLAHYLPFATTILPDVKNAGSLSPDQLKQKEGELVISRLKKEDLLVLLDEKGKQLTSVEFSNFIEQKLQLGSRRLVFLVGGAWGFSETIYQRADQKLSLSKMTFSHQMVRLFFLEQLYRAMTILRGESYHNE
ncbi:MAG: 23S rRNA (pseudouridine(1915)-N(3))-methyltransferase RlmH [Saprospiraceae bacterium]|nr:23S rRNA (pseudouridine(1915)-N(3))-methyltransferase RlmH [Saprospiraceae bacterium]MCF8252488.1 23S rRNA (pseudouridine(1915)-N(3))-methyltransferase RlmH [Saprospiraceae bacterium]MCF8282489.1 23S rRNA (pseudouridine(1915)-N(3))-methyltransferase RlmH [Bacteroidales bacterium]MCF8312645.1 23S rRNA (pseudouridine(1915)-N(3))-methyltransferase RlmH [Saprospiraceae bacterium]MCF8441089.1 23S rRNA (pseudouridine(1915)-N(3))-methyltransferase RlmH [Saprospiraceae bacterium]